MTEFVDDLLDFVDDLLEKIVSNGFFFLNV